MSIVIYPEKCKGCVKCTIVCPGTLIAMENGKAYMRYPKDCWGCASCLKECAHDAIALYLGADICGVGSRMSVALEGDLIHWQIKKTDGAEEIITVNKKDSNKY